MGEFPPNLRELRQLIDKADTFVDTVELLEFGKFDSDKVASKQMEAFSNGQVTAELREFLLSCLPKVEAGKKNNFSLGVENPELGYNIYDAAKIPCQSNDFVYEVFRGVRMHFDTYKRIIDVMGSDTENVDNEDVNKETAKSSGSAKKRKSSEIGVEETPMQP